MDAAVKALKAVSGEAVDRYRLVFKTPFDDAPATEQKRQLSQFSARGGGGDGVVMPQSKGAGDMATVSWRLPGTSDDWSISANWTRG